MSAERIDHAANAIAMLAVAAGTSNTDHAYEAGVEALVHATLAVAQEQRVANAIAILSASGGLLDDVDEASAKTAVSVGRLKRSNVLRAVVREGLGL